MFNTDGGSWLKEAAREVPILVLGILIAFALQAWWDGARSSSDAKRTLAAVESELTENIDGLRQYIAWHQRVASAAKTVHETLSGVSVGQSVVVSDSLLTAVLVSPTFDGQTGTMEAAQEAALAPPSVRTSMTRWLAALSDAQEEERRSREFTDQRLSQFLSSRVSLPDADLSIPWLYETLPSPIEGSTEIEASSELRFLISMRLKYADLAQLELSEALSEAELAQTTLRGWLEGGGD